MEIIDGEFVMAHVGSPGADVSFRIRWDLPYVALFYSSGVIGNSHSMSQADQSDVFCFGEVCRRLSFVALSQEPAATGLFMNQDSNAQGHTGVLGLAPGSPIYGIYPWVRYSAYELCLFVHRPANDSRRTRHRAFAQDSAVVANGRPDRLHVDLAIDFNVLNGSAYRADSRVAVKVLGSLRFVIDTQAMHMHTSDGSRVHAVSYSPLTGITLGRSMASVLFDTLVGPSGSVLSLQPIADAVPVSSLLDYLPYLLPVLVILIVWLLALAEDQLGSVKNWMPGGGHYFVSLRNESFAQDFYLMCELTLGIIMVTIFWAMGLGRMELVSSSRQYTKALAYSCLGVVPSLLAVASSPRFSGQQAIYYGGAAFLVSGWLLLKLASPLSIIRILMLLLAMMAEALLHFSMFDIVLGARHERDGEGAATALAKLVSVAFSAWGAWFCSFSAVPYAIRTWRPGHPALLQLAVLMFSLVVMFSYTLFYSKRLKLLKYKMMHYTELWYSRLAAATLRRQAMQSRPPPQTSGDDVDP
jgi:hypothetical protein